MILQDLEKKQLIHPPSFLLTNTMYCTLMGSQSYGCAVESSDFDVYGFCIPHKDMVFPHLAGEVLGFGKQIKRFEQWQESHIIDPSAVGGKGREYDFTVYNIVKYFQLLMDNNPNIIDSIFTDQTCVLHTTEIGNMVRDSRKIFLHKGAWHKFRGYSYAQAHKMNLKEATGKRKELVEKYSFDVKFGMHLVRLLNEIEQILVKGDLDLQENNEQLKAIRRGEVAQEDILKWMASKEIQLEKLYHESKLPWGPDEDKIKALLLQCLEHHYGSLEKAIERPDKYRIALMNVKEILDSVKI